MSESRGDHRRRHRLGAAVLGVALVIGVPLAGAGTAGAAAGDACAALQQPIQQRGTATGKATLLTAAATAADTAAYPVDLGTLVRAGVAPADGLAEVHLLKKGSDNLYVTAGAELTGAVKKYGYRDTGIAFFASKTALSCTIPVYRYRSNTTHRQVTAEGRSAVAAAGWVAEGISFHAAAADATPITPPVPPNPPAPGTDTKFSIAVDPDTQGETNDPNDPRFLDRSTWLVNHAGADDLDLRFVTHTGDVVNWDTDDHAQYKVASAAMRPLEQAGIPYSLSIGNHDTMATGGGNGGSARDPKNTKTLVRVTETFNSYFTAARYSAVSGAFEPGKVDNIYSEFTAGGAKWLVLNLELWPRSAAVEWAEQVVAAHPSSNVLVATHSYLEDDGSIGQTASYGATSPQYLYDHLISRYANIKMVFSGHTGVAASRTDTGVHGNKIRSFLATIHSPTTNPVRILEIDTAADTVTSKIVAPYDNSTAWRSYDLAISGMGWITG